MTSLSSNLAWIAASGVLAAAGVALGLWLGRRKRASDATTVSSPVPPAVDERSTLRAASLDSLEEAVLIADRDGRIRDCNSSALTLFGRHRGELEDQYAAGLRRFDGLNQAEPYRVASEQAVWRGEGWARLPDGGMKLCQTRVIAIRDARARIVAFAESYREVANDRDIEQEMRDLVYGVRAFESTVDQDDATPSVREDLRVLSEGFRDLEHVLKHYERLLPSLGADDPIAESIAGAAHDVRTAVAAVGVQALLQEIPRALARLRGRMPPESESTGERGAYAAASAEPPMEREPGS